MIITQYGYVTDNNGKIIGKYDNDINTGNQVNLPDGYTFTSVADEASLQAITLSPKPSDIQAQLNVIDLKSIRAIRTNDTARMAQWEAQAQALRAQL